jgi:hypothetical protein
MAAEKKPINWRAWIVAALVTLLAAVGIGALIGYIAPLVRRHRREGRGQDKAG